MKEKIGIAVVLIVAVSGIFIYFGLKENDPGTEKEIVLRYMGWGTELEQKATEKLIKKFEAQHPGIRVNYSHIPDGYAKKLERLVEMGKEPDVAMVLGTDAMKMAEEGKLKNIAGLAAEDDTYSLENVLPQTVYWWDSDKALGVNSALEISSLVYNKEITSNAGVQIPSKLEDAWDWDSFIEAARKLTTDQNGRNALDPGFDPDHIKCYGIKMELQNSYLLSNLYALSGEEFLDKTGRKVNLGGTKALEGIQKISDLINVYHVMPDPMESKNLPAGAKALESGVAAVVLTGTWVLMDLAETGTDFGIGVLPAMYGKPVAISMGEPIVIFDSSRYPEESWELVKFLMNPEYNRELIEDGLWMPVLKSWYENPVLLNSWSKGNPAHPDEYNDAVIEPAFKSCKPHWGYSVKNFAKISDVLSPKLDEVWMGKITAKKAAASVEKKINALADGEYKRP